MSSVVLVHVGVQACANRHVHGLNSWTHSNDLRGVAPFVVGILSCCALCATFCCDEADGCVL